MSRSRNTQMQHARRRVDVARWLWAMLLGSCCSLTLGQAGSSAPRVFGVSDGAHSGGSAPVEFNAMLPRGVVKLAEEEQFLIWVDLAAGKLNILERSTRGGMELRLVIPASIGKNGFGKQVEGDRKTPVGTYRLTSFLTDEQLIDFYGLGAFPLNYPNILDRRSRRTGSGIWLHGLPKDVATRPLMDSDGCVVIDNDSLEKMHQYITTGSTHMILADGPLVWEPVAAAGTRRQGLEQAITEWEHAWEDKDNAAYLSFYAEDFSDFSRNRAQWADYKTRVNNGKRWIEVEASQFSFFADHNQPELVTVRFYQDYSSSNYQWRGWKEQLWRETADGWEIIYEGNG